MFLRTPPQHLHYRPGVRDGLGVGAQAPVVQRRRRDELQAIIGERPPPAGCGAGPAPGTGCPQPRLPPARLPRRSFRSLPRRWLQRSGAGVQIVAHGVGQQDAVGLPVRDAVQPSHVVAGCGVQAETPEGCQGRHGAGRLGVEERVDVAVLAAGQVFKQQPDGVQGHPVADGVVPGGVDGLNRDAELPNGRGDQDAQRRGGQGLAVDDDRTVRHPLARDDELTPQLMVGDAASAAAELGAAHDGGRVQLILMGNATLLW